MPPIKLTPGNAKLILKITNYILHHTVVSINELSKSRGCLMQRAKYRGTSLNENLLKGPNC